MTIEYDRERKAYVDSDNGEYITFEQGDRESCLYYYYLHDAEGNFQIGAHIQRYVAEFIRDLDNPTHWQYIVITAWQPNTSLPKNREILEETDPRIQRLGEFVFARHWWPREPKEGVRLEFLVDYNGEKTLKELYRYG